MAIAEHLGPNTNLPDELGPLLNSASSKPVVEEFSIQKLRMWMPRTSWSGFLIVWHSWHSGTSRLVRSYSGPFDHNSQQHLFQETNALTIHQLMQLNCSSPAATNGILDPIATSNVKWIYHCLRWPAETIPLIHVFFSGYSKLPNSLITFLVKLSLIIYIEPWISFVSLGEPCIVYFYVFVKQNICLFTAESQHLVVSWI